MSILCSVEKCCMDTYSWSYYCDDFDDGVVWDNSVWDIFETVDDAEKALDEGCDTCRCAGGDWDFEFFDI